MTGVVQHFYGSVYQALHNFLWELKEHPNF